MMGNMADYAANLRVFAREKVGEPCHYDYDNQAWVVDGKYVRCGHHDTMSCSCFGKLHEGEEEARR